MFETIGSENTDTVIENFDRDWSASKKCDYKLSIDKSLRLCRFDLLTPNFKQISSIVKVIYEED